MNENQKYYSTCEDCPLSVFMLCLKHDNSKYLHIKGTVNSEELTLAWANLFSEFIDLSQDNEQMYILHLQREIQLLSVEITEVETTVYFLQPACLFLSGDSEREVLVNVLREYDYPCEFDFTDPNYPDRLEVVMNLLSSKKLKFQMKAKELNDYIEERGSDSFDENYFYRQLSRLAKFQRVAVIRPKDITVLEFIILDKEYQQANTKIENIED
jgi:hypothetical protein